MEKIFYALLSVLVLLGIALGLLVFVYIAQDVISWKQDRRKK